MNNLIHKRIVLGITGGIAAYKSADLVRRLREQSVDVRVVMTRNACEFITPLTMQALSGRSVHTELLNTETEAAMGHIELARWSDVVMIAPASANFIAKLAHGQADDLLSTLCLATTSPIVLAPAMNQQMWLNSATQTNIALLQQRGIRLLGPVEGNQACGETGPGRMLEPDQLVKHVNAIFKSELLTGIKILVTAGPTREDIDPVRYISNRSSGRMGYAVARAATEAGAQVTLVSGPTTLIPPDRVNLVTIQTAAQMRDAVLSDVKQQNIFVAAAAVADYSCEEVAIQKIKKRDEKLVLKLCKTPDILSEIANMTDGPFTVGFAAETEGLQQNARIKLEAKGLDMIAANKVGDGTGFDSEENSLQLFWIDGNIDLGHDSKEKLARQLIQVIAQRYNERKRAQTH